MDTLKCTPVRDIRKISTKFESKTNHFRSKKQKNKDKRALDYIFLNEVFEVG